MEETEEITDEPNEIKKPSEMVTKKPSEEEKGLDDFWASKDDEVKKPMKKVSREQSPEEQEVDDFWGSQKEDEPVKKSTKKSTEEPEKVKPKTKKIGAKKTEDNEETSEQPEEVKKPKRKSIGDGKKSKISVEKPVPESIDVPDNVNNAVDIDVINEDDLKPSKSSSRRSSKKEKSPEKVTPSIEVCNINEKYQMERDESISWTIFGFLNLYHKNVRKLKRVQQNHNAHMKHTFLNPITSYSRYT